MNRSDWHALSISTLSEAIQNREVSVSELINNSLSRAEKLQPLNNAFISILSQRAREQAEVADRQILNGQYRGVLHGIPFAVKDNFFTEGIRTTSGSKLFKNYKPTHSATVIEKLETAGAILIGKTNMHEFAYGLTNKNETYGTTRNPWDLNRLTGGSSGGSAAAVSSGSVTFALGSDTGGSVRVPSSLCGVVGYKPAFGRVSKFGVYALSSSMDHVGVMGRSVDDIAIVMDVIAGFDQKDNLSLNDAPPEYLLFDKPDPKSIKIGIPDSYFFQYLENDVSNLAGEAINKIRNDYKNMKRVSIPDAEMANETAGYTLHSEAAKSLGFTMMSNPNLIGGGIKQMLEMFGQQPKFLVEEVKGRIESVRKEWRGLLEKVDILITPGVGFTAPAIDKISIKTGDGPVDVDREMSRCTMIFNLLGFPAIVLPIGLSSDGLPISMQMISCPEKEKELLNLARALEQKHFMFQQPPG